MNPHLGQRDTSSDRAQDLPLDARAERVDLALTRQTIELLAELLAGVLAELEALIQHGRANGFTTPAIVAERIAVIDALAELRGER